MSIEITMGWWLLPFALTVAGLSFTTVVSFKDRDGWLAGLGTILAFFASSFVSLLAWLVWALATRTS
jgi:hypothetical protein